MWFIGVEVEQETSAPPPKKNPGSASAMHFNGLISKLMVLLIKEEMHHSDVQLL